MLYKYTCDNINIINYVNIVDTKTNKLFRHNNEYKTCITKLINNNDIFLHIPNKYGNTIEHYNKGWNAYYNFRLNVCCVMCDTDMHPIIQQPLNTTIK